MRIDILTLFPEMFEPIKSSILGRAIDKGILNINLVQIRDFSIDKHKKVDDTPYGGGAGMVMACQPLFDAIQSVADDNCKIVYMSPKGRLLEQSVVESLSKINHIVVVCGHYEGIDQRVIEHFNMQ